MTGVRAVDDERGAEILDALYRHVLHGEAEPAAGQVRAGLAQGLPATALLFGR